MTNVTELEPIISDGPVPVADPLRLAVAAYLARFKGSSREHTESDLRCHLTWCAELDLDPLAVPRPHLELHVRWISSSARLPYQGRPERRIGAIGAGVLPEGLLHTEHAVLRVCRT